MKDNTSYAPKDIEAMDELMFKIYKAAEKIYQKYASDEYKEAFFSKEDYSQLLKIYADAKFVYDQAPKLFNKKIDTFKWYVPFDLRWKIPSKRKYNHQNIKDMILLCYDVKELSDDLEFLYDYHRAGSHQNRILTGFDLKNMKYDLEHLRLIIDYGKRTYGLDFKEAITEIPDDIMIKIPLNGRVN